MFATFFEWQVNQGQQEEFARLWALGTEALLQHGSLGSALFVNDAGHYCAFARWPSREVRDAAFGLNVRPDVFEPFRACIAQSIARIDLEEIDNLWINTC